MAQSKVADDLRQRVLALSPRDRLALAAELFDSVEGSDPEWEQAWALEIDRRAAEIDSGAARTIPWPEARARLEARLGQKP